MKPVMAIMNSQKKRLFAAAFDAFSAATLMIASSSALARPDAAMIVSSSSEKRFDSCRSRRSRGNESAVRAKSRSGVFGTVVSGSELGQADVHQQVAELAAGLVARLEGALLLDADRLLHRHGLAVGAGGGQQVDVLVLVAR